MLRPELGEGPLTADLWVCGRDYGAEEERAQRPFVGSAGKILDGALKAAGLRRSEVRIDNLVPKRPPQNKWELHKPGDIEWGKERLRALLARAKPTVIVTLGNEASEFLLGSLWPRKPNGNAEGIQSVRGYLFDSAFGRVITAVHPASVLRDWTPWRALLDLDMRKAKRELLEGAPPLPERHVTIGTRAEDTYEIMDAELFAADIENTHDLKLACVGFAAWPERAVVVPAKQEWQHAAIRTLCESSAGKVFQNGAYDRFFLQHFNDIRTANVIGDIMLGWHALQPELAGKKTRDEAKKKAYSRRSVKSLKFLASIYTRDTWWKDYGFANEDERYILCGRDCCVTLEIWQKMQAQFTRDVVEAL